MDAGGHGDDRQSELRRGANVIGSIADKADGGARASNGPRKTDPVKEDVFALFVQIAEGTEGEERAQSSPS